jgi:fatty-acyl-CoA synthase
MAAVAPDACGLSCTDTVLPVVPMFHANAWGIPFNAAMVGAKQVLPGRYLDPASIVELLAAERVTRTAGVPTIWGGILEYLDAHQGEHDLSALRDMTVGGSAAPESLIAALAERHGLRVTHAWGMTETSPLGSVASDRPETAAQSAAERLRHRATQGHPVPLIEIRGRNDDGVIPWDGQTMGELEIRGPWVAAAYHGIADDPAFTDDGWFRTGDIVTIGRDAELVIQDRSKDLVKSGGEWISSVLLETHLMGHSHVAEAAVVAIAHARWTERPLAVVVPRPGCCPNVAELQRHIAARFAKWWVPDDVVFVDALPRTGTGKVRKLALRATYAAHYAAGRETAT